MKTIGSNWNGTFSVLSNIESINAVLIHQQLTQSERLIQLNQIAISQMKSLINNNNLKKLR